MSTKPYRTFKKEKWIFFALSILVYFAPFVTVAACMFPLMHKADTGYKAALGILIVFINALPFLVGILHSFLAHFPMFNMFAVGFCVLGALFTFDIFAEYVDKFLWIEFAAMCGSVVACIFWHLHKKYARYAESVKATVLSGAFEAKKP